MQLKKQASKQANIHTRVRNEVTLVWGWLRLAPITDKVPFEHTQTLWGYTCMFSSHTIIHVLVSSMYTSIDRSTIHAWRGRFLTSWWKGVRLHACNNARIYTYTYKIFNQYTTECSCTTTGETMITTGGEQQLTHKVQHTREDPQYAVYILWQKVIGTLLSGTHMPFH